MEPETFLINLKNDTFIALQMKSFGSSIFKLLAGVINCHFDNFSVGTGMAMPYLYDPQESLAGFQKLCLLCFYEFLAMLEGKTRKGLLSGAK